MRIRPLALFALLMFVATSTGCFKHTFVMGSGAPEKDGNEVYSSWHSHWLFGIIGNETVDVDKLCPSGNARVYERVTFLNALIGTLIGVVYYPTTVTIWCDRGHAGDRTRDTQGRLISIELPPDTAARIVAAPEFLDWVRQDAPERLADARRAVRMARARVEGRQLAAASTAP